MRKTTSRVRRAMAKAEAVDTTPFDPTKVAGDTPKKRRSRAKATHASTLGDEATKRPAGAEPAIDEDAIPDDADATAHPETFETRPPDLVEAEWLLAKECAP